MKHARARDAWVLFLVATLTGWLSVCWGDTTPCDMGRERDPEPDLKGDLAERGVEYSLSLTNIYQRSVRGGAGNRREQFTGSYDIELAADLSELLGIGNAGLYVRGEGSWPRTDIDAASIDSLFGVNGDAGGRRSLDVTEFWYEQSFNDGELLLRLGKFDITGGFQCHGCPFSFDGNLYANDETTQFTNAALVNNAAIPFPDNGLGAIVHWHPAKRWYFSIGVIDAMADSSETGFRTAFHDQDYFFYILEAGTNRQLDSNNGPLCGTYRIGMWNDPRPKGNSASTELYRDDTGFYANFDQMLVKENRDSDDAQGLSVFGRYGYVPGRTNDIARFWSAGLQYQGPVNGRDDDVLGFGFAQGFLSDSASVTYSADYESVAEIYYNMSVDSRVSVTPSIQYICNPGGSDRADDVVVFGIRMQVSF